MKARMVSRARIQQRREEERRESLEKEREGNEVQNNNRNDEKGWLQKAQSMEPKLIDGVGGCHGMSPAGHMSMNVSTRPQAPNWPSG